MSVVKILAFALFVVVQAASQDASRAFPYAVPQAEPSGPPAQAECRFPDGKTITVDYSTQHVFNDIAFVTDESLITVKGIGVPAGNYTIVASGDLHKWTLFMKKHTGGEFCVPMSVAKLPSPAETASISFEHTGGSCTMRFNSKNSNTQISVEFTEKNADLPVMN